MKLSEKPEFGVLMGAVSEYYGREISDAMLDMYWHGLEHFDVASVRSALNMHMQSPDNGQYFPKISDLVKFISGTGNDKAMLAWSKVDKAVRHVGPYQTVVFDDPIIHLVLSDMGGWVALGSKEDEEWPFVAREFENRYRGYCTRKIESWPRKLIGLSESHNEREGFVTEPPMLIGDAVQAQLVLTGGTDKPMIEFTRASTSITQPLRLVSERDDAA